MTFLIVSKYDREVNSLAAINDIYIYIFLHFRLVQSFTRRTWVGFILFRRSRKGKRNYLCTNACLFMHK
jgi:hypothetical protein